LPHLHDSEARCVRYSTIPVDISMVGRRQGLLARDRHFPRAWVGGLIFPSASSFVCPGHNLERKRKNPLVDTDQIRGYLDAVRAAAASSVLSTVTLATQMRYPHFSQRDHRLMSPSKELQAVVPVTTASQHQGLAAGGLTARVSNSWHGGQRWDPRLRASVSGFLQRLRVGYSPSTGRAKP
jgi:hypothetical protein